MRISDWSSDVCSSDLRIIGIRSDTHRNPLRHFHEIAGRIVGFDDGKFVACRRSDPFDLAVNVRSLKRIDSNDNRLSRRDARRLGLLEVGGYPDHRRHQKGELRARCHILPKPHADFTQSALLWRAYDRVGKFDLGQMRSEPGAFTSASKTHEPH